jgi:hypothetical protein
VNQAINPEYLKFIESKTKTDKPSGFEIAADQIGFGGMDLKPFQRDIVKWALRRGRAAVFANTGLGKTAMQTTWAGHVAEHSGLPVLIAAPLCVARRATLICASAVSAGNMGTQKKCASTKERQARDIHIP